MDERRVGTGRRDSDHSRWVIHVRENWYRDVWLFVLSLVCLLSVAKAINTANDAHKLGLHIQASRSQAIYDNCQLLRNLVLTAGKISKKPRAQHDSRQFLSHVGLSDCIKYTINLTGQRPQKDRINAAQSNTTAR